MVYSRAYAYLVGGVGLLQTRNGGGLLHARDISQFGKTVADCRELGVRSSLRCERIEIARADRLDGELTVRRFYGERASASLLTSLTRMLSDAERFAELERMLRHGQTDILVRGPQTFGLVQIHKWKMEILRILLPRHRR